MSLLLAAVAIASFPGGNYNDLAKSISEATKQSVVVVLSAPPKPLKAFQYNEASLDELGKAIQTNTGLMRMPGIHMLFTDGLLPLDKIGKAGPGLGQITMKDFPETAVANGAVTFSTEKSEGLKLDSLKGFAKPVKLHWYYTGLTAGMQVKGTPELDFLGLLARTLGARFQNTTNEFKIDFEPVEIRNRAIRTIQADKAEGDEMEKKRQSFRVAALNMLTPAQLTELFSQAGKTVRTQIRSGSQVENEAVALIRATEAEQGIQADVQQQGRQRTGPPRDPANQVSILARVDPRRPAFLVTDQLFESWVDVPVFGGGGGRAGAYEAVLRRGGGGNNQGQRGGRGGG